MPSKPRSALGFIILCLSLLAGLVCLILYGCNEAFKPLVTRFDTATAPAKIEQWYGVHLPPSARDMYFADSTEGFQISYTYVRFSIAPNEIDEAIDRIKTHRLKSYAFGELKKSDIQSSELIQPIDSLKPVNWWQLSAIHHGYSLTSAQSPWVIRLWVDLDKNVIYVYESH